MLRSWRVWFVSVLLTSGTIVGAAAQVADDALQMSLARLAALRTVNQQALAETMAPEFASALAAVKAADTPETFRYARERAAALCLRDDLTVMRLYAFGLWYEGARGAGGSEAECEGILRDGMAAARLLGQKRAAAKWLPGSMLYALQLAEKLRRPAPADVAAAVEFAEVLRPWGERDPVEGAISLVSSRLLLASIYRKAGQPDEAVSQLQKVEQAVETGEAAGYHALQARLERARILLDQKAPRRQVDPLLHEVVQHPLTDEATRTQAWALLERK